MKKEIEATFLSINKEQIRALLKEKGFILKTKEYMMKRKTFDIPMKQGLKRWARVRQEYDKVTMTIKEVRGVSINDTYEVELVVNDFDVATSFLEACNLYAKAFQENLREVWVRNGAEATIDTWPGLNTFIEIEGENEEIVREISGELGFDFKEAVFGSIDLVYEKELGISADTIIHLPEITFANPPKKNAA